MQQERKKKWKRVNHTKVHNIARKEKKWDLRMNPKRRKKYKCTHTEQKNSKRTSKR